MMKRSLLCACVLVLVVSCSGVTEPPRVRVLGAVAGYQDDDPRIALRTEGRTVHVTISTYGGGCDSRGDTEVVVQGLVADISPYDYTAVAGTACTRELKTFLHEVAVEFQEGGTARLRIRGIDTRALTTANMIGDTIIVERSVALP